MLAFLEPVTIRPSYPDDDAAVRRLAALDSATVPAGPFLLAEVDGELRAALSLADGKAIADPFVPTRDLVTMLREYAAGDLARGKRGRGTSRRRAQYPPSRLAPVTGG